MAETTSGFVIKSTDGEIQLTQNIKTEIVENDCPASLNDLPPTSQLQANEQEDRLNLIKEKSELSDDDEIKEILETIDPSNSDIEFEDDKKDEVQNVGGLSEIDIDEPEDEDISHEDSSNHATVRQNPSQRWRHKNEFSVSNLHNENNLVSSIPEVQAPMQYFEKYLKADFFEEMAEFTNRRYVLVHGKSLDTTPDEIRIYWGASIALSLLGFPKIRMCWEQKTRYPLIADNISRDRFYLLRNNLKVVDDNSISENSKSSDRYWKIRPMLDRVRNACLQHVRPEKVSVDKQMIPFHGTVRMKQYIKGKPKSVGLKNFVMTTSFGLPLDFLMYEGGGREIIPEKVPLPDKLDVGGKVALKLSDSLPSGSTVFMDQYFSSITLQDVLLKHRSIYACSTLMSSRIPRSVNLKKDNDLKHEGRGSSNQVVRSDEKIVIVKWYDNRPIHIASTIYGTLPLENCKRWSKKDSKYIEIPCPHLVKMYNENMGGVNLLDRIIGKYPMRNRTNKWTVRMLHHFYDFAIAAAWIEYRHVAQKNKRKRKEILTYFSFKLNISQHLLYHDSNSKRDELTDENNDDEKRSNSKGKHRSIEALPPPAKRTCNAMHLPELLNKEMKCRSRCRAEGCSGLTFVRCTACKVFLCFTSERNCFKNFHMI